MAPQLTGTNGLSPRACAVDGAGQQLLSRSGLAFDQHGNRTRSHAAGAEDHALDNPTAMDDGGEFWGFGGQSCAEALQFFIRPPEQVRKEVR